MTKDFKMNNSILKIIVVIGSIAATTIQLSAAAPSKKSMAPKTAPIAPLDAQTRNQLYLQALKLPPCSQQRAFACSAAFLGNQPRVSQCIRESTPQSKLEAVNYFRLASQYPVGSPERMNACQLACTSLVTPCAPVCLTAPMVAPKSVPCPKIIFSPAATARCVKNGKS